MNSARPWEAEPDSLDFEAEGLPCVMRRNPRWATWCGYVGIPADHPLYGLPTNHPLKLPSSWFEGRSAKQGFGYLDLFLHAVSGQPNIEDACPISLAFEVHGGVNYAENDVPGRAPDGRWWFGFDCGHAGDFIPGGEAIDRMTSEIVETMPEQVRDTMRKIMRETAARTGDYRDQQYVVGECQSLAAQLIAVVKVIARENVNGGTDYRKN